MVEVTDELARAVEGTWLLGGSHSRDAIVRAVLPIVEAQRQAGVQQGLDMAAGVMDARVALYRTKAAGRDATAPDCQNAYDGSILCAEASEYGAAAIRKLGGDDGTD